MYFFSTEKTSSQRLTVTVRAVSVSNRRSRSTKRRRDLHAPCALIHRAIEALDLDLLKKLHAKGHYFCHDNGHNCFIVAALSPRSDTQSRWKFVTEMLKLDARGSTSKNEGIEIGSNLKNIGTQNC
jgi:hypothetical protein